MSDLSDINPQMERLTPAKLNKAPLVFTAVLAGVIGFVLLINRFKPQLPCIACERGSWWYRCQPGTGIGSDTCRRLESGQIAISDIINKTEQLQKKLEQLSEDVKKPAQAVREAAQDIRDAVSTAVDSYNPAKLLDDKILSMIQAGIFVPQIPGVPSVNMSDVINKVSGAAGDALDAMGLGGVKLDVGDAINNALAQSADAFAQSMRPAGQALGKGMETVWRAALTPFDEMAGRVEDAWDMIADEWKPVLNEIRCLRSEIGQLLDGLKDDVGDVMWLGIVSSIQKVFPFLPAVVAILLLLMLIGMVFAGSMFGVYRMASLPVRAIK